MATANIDVSKPTLTKIPDRSRDQIIDELFGRSYDLAGIAAVVDKLADCQAPGAWGEVFMHLRGSLNGISRNLLVEVEALRDLEESQ